MQRILQDFQRKIKCALLDDHFYMTCLMIAVGIIAFEIGRFSTQSKTEGAAAIVWQAAPKTIATSTIVEKGASAHERSQESELPYAGSKNGSVYYPASCSSLRRVKSENRIYFATIAEAEAAGRKRSAQCK